MNLPDPQSPFGSPGGRDTTSSHLAVYASTHSGGIRKRAVVRNRAISTPQADRLHHFALDQATGSGFQAVVPSSSGYDWLTPRHSPQPSFFEESVGLDPFPEWGVPTPPCSDSGVPALSVDAGDEPPRAGVTASAFDQTVTPAEMSSLGYLLPSRYGSGTYGSDVNNYSMDQNYPPPVRSQPSTTAHASYAQTASSSPAFYQNRAIHSPSSGRRHSDLPPPTGDTMYGAGFRRIGTSYDSPAAKDYPVPAGQTIPSIGGLTASPMASSPLGGASSSGMTPATQYNPAFSRQVGTSLRNPSACAANVRRPPSMYDSNLYGPPLTSGLAPAHMYAPMPNMTYPPPFVGNDMGDPSRAGGSDPSVRVVDQRPKPQCWDHGCNGRQFSTFSNLLRHQREKSGTATKSYCPRCGAEFTRTTARNGHLAHDKCARIRRPSEDGSN